MKRLYNLWVALLVLMLLSFASCSKDEPADNTQPTAVILTPLEQDEFIRGQSLIFNGVFEDDRKLSHVEISIAENSSLKGFDTPWEATEVIELMGKSTEINGYELFDGEIPADIMSGNYSLKVLVVDKALNFSSYNVGIVIE
ncbi:DUF4625 domain-containing protein [Carboxylicivirga sp. RSCT41]|uniref:DUF4625 domain-containing protein n=1 Tax=Carboxylicivirga agarovorans TaxID=3417570 RepID=UPI003D327226